MITKREFYIDGKWVAPLVAKDCAVIDPSTEEACAVISLGSEADTDRAVAAAKAAFPGLGRDASGRAAAAGRGHPGAIQQAQGRDGAGHQHRDGRAHRHEPGRSGGMPALASEELPEGLRPHGVDQAPRPPCAGHDDRAGADRGCRPDHALELADEPGDAEGDPGASGGLHLCAEAVGGIAAVVDAVRRILP